MSHPHPKRSFVPQAVLTRSGKLSTASAVVNTTRTVNTAASKQTVNHPRPINNTFKRGYSQSSRPFNRYFANKNRITKTNVNIVSVKHTTARDRAVVRNKGKGANVVKASACWVSIGDGKGRNTGKGRNQNRNIMILRMCTSVLELKYRSVHQVLLKVPRKDNIYSVDLKSVVPTGDLTCLIAKATIDESNTWHRRLGHINFKTMNKLVKGNLVKIVLPLKDIKNDQSCVACQKGRATQSRPYKTKL
ncbi:putative ribonuclease H-like domain-containing protein [Tanacetum coccineum]